MDSCLLCLHTDFNSFIPLNSPQWLDCKILSKIEKHFWSVDNIGNVLGICYSCWSKLNDFHAFYKTIEEAHCTNIKIPLEGERMSKNCSLQTEMFQLGSPQIFKNNFASNEESAFRIDDDVGIKKTRNDDKSLLYAHTTVTNNEMDFNTIQTEKRKRGRPRKKCIIKETLPKKTNGKRGRPRKCILDVHEKCTDLTSFQNDAGVTYANIFSQDIPPSKNDSMHVTNPIYQQEAAQEAGFVKFIPPNVKRNKGRPRKTQLNKDASIINNETSNFAAAVHVLEIPENKVLTDKQCPTVQAKVIEKDVLLNLNKAEKFLYKKTVSSFLKKRKRIKQHKALMRNYIATSVRCMKFFKN